MTARTLEQNGKYGEQGGQMNGILFKEADTKAIVEGRKRQIRRVIKPQPKTDGFDGYRVESGFYEPAKVDRNGDLYPGDEVFGLYDLEGDRGWVAPYQPGEVVYVRETWAGADWEDDLPPSGMCRYPGLLHYKATADEHTECIRGRWRPPLSMPAWAARFFLKIPRVRAERLQEITFADCLAEGIIETRFWRDCDYEPLRLERDYMRDNPDSTEEEAKDEINQGWNEYVHQAFRNLWDSINPKHPWASNSWVWVYEFERTAK